MRHKCIVIPLLALLGIGTVALVYDAQLSPRARLTWGADRVCDFHSRCVSWPGDNLYCLKARMSSNVAARRIRALGLPCQVANGEAPPEFVSWEHPMVGSWWDPSTNFVGSHWDGEVGQRWFEMAKYENGWLYYISSVQ